MNENRSSVPEREEIRFTSARRGGSVLRLDYCCWSDHEAGVITLLSNGKRLHAAIQVHEARRLALALLALCDERGWK